jgi:TRAP-type C4-dicarboxylate transport system permease large subunit
MSPEMTGVVGIILLIVLILLRVSVGLSLFLVGFLGVSLLAGWEVGLSQLGTSAFGQVNNYSLSVIPLFILMGMFMSNTGLGKDLFNAVDKWLGHFRGGLAIATIGASSIFAAISGSSNATTATLAKIAIPEMNQYNYKTTFSTAAVAAGGTLGILIPPSVILILYGALTSEPIGPLLIGGLIPGIIMTVLFMIMINIQVPMTLTALVGSLDVSPYLIMALILIVYFFLGMFLEGIAIMVLTLPIVYPIVTQLGFDGLWFGIIMVMVLNIGILTPPLGLSVYIISGIVKDVPIEKIFKGVVPSIITMVIFTIILIIFPEIVTFLPSFIE